MTNRNFKKSIYLITGILLCSLSSMANPKLNKKMVNGIPVTNVTTQQLNDAKAGLAANVNNQWVKGNSIFTQLTDKNPAATIGWLGLAMSATSVEQYSYAVSQAKKNLKSASDGEKLLVKLHMAYLDGNQEKQLAVSKKLIERFPQSSWAWIERGNTLENAKDTKTARKAFAQASVVAPGDIEPLLKSGNSYLFSEPKDFNVAEHHFSKAVDLQSSNAWVHISLGDVHRAQLDLKASLADYSRAAVLDPSNNIAFTKKGHANTFLGNYQDARRDFDQATRVGTEVASNFNQNYKAFTFIYEGKPEASVKALSQHIKTIDKSSVDEHQKTQAKVFTVSNLTEIALHTQDMGNAKKFIDLRKQLTNQQIANISNDNLKRKLRSGNHFLEGRLENVKGNYKGAMASADKMRLLLTPIKDERKYEDYHELQALVAMSKEQWSQAISHFDKANSDKLTVKFNKAVALEKSGDNQNAHRLFKEVRDYNFNSVYFALLRGEAQQHLDQISGIVTASK